MMGKIGVEGGAVAVGREWVSPSTTSSTAGEDDDGLAAPRLVDRRIAGATGCGAGIEPVHGDVGALAGQRRGQLLDRVAGRSLRRPLALPDDDHVPGLVQPQ